MGEDEEEEAEPTGIDYALYTLYFYAYKYARSSSLERIDDVDLHWLRLLSPRRAGYLGVVVGSTLAY